MFWSSEKRRILLISSTILLALNCRVCVLLSLMPHVPVNNFSIMFGRIKFNCRLQIEHVNSDCALSEALRVSFGHLGSAFLPAVLHRKLSLAAAHQTFL